MPNRSWWRCDQHNALVLYEAPITLCLWHSIVHNALNYQRVQVILPLGLKTTPCVCKIMLANKMMTLLFLHFTFPVGTDQLLNVESMLIQRWASNFLNHLQRWYTVEKWVENVTMINQKSTSQPHFNQILTKFEVEIPKLKNGWNLVEVWLIFGWFEVENLIFGWSLLHFQLISQPNFHVDIWLRNWFVPTVTGFGQWEVLIDQRCTESCSVLYCNPSL